MTDAPDPETIDAAFAALAEANPQRALGTAPTALFDRIVSRGPAVVPAWRSAPAVAGGLTAVLAVAAVIGVATTWPSGGGDDGPGIAADSARETGGEGLAALCVELYSPETLPNRQFAFDGVVESIDGTMATFRVSHVYLGEPGETITLEAGSLLSLTADNETVLEPGGRYLVSGDDVFAWSCGFTQPWSEDLAAEWASAVGQ
jgi:hypothetical protein